jgi:hypothetical protein
MRTGVSSLIAKQLNKTLAVRWRDLYDKQKFKMGLESVREAHTKEPMGTVRESKYYEYYVNESDMRSIH